MKKVLIIQQKMIGDVLLSSILCEWVRKHYPEAEIHYIVNDYTVAVVQNNPFIDKLIVFERKHRKNKWEFNKFLRSIHQEQYDWVIDAFGRLESNLMTFASSAPRRTSYHKNYTKMVYTETVKRKGTVYTNAGNALEDRLRLVVPEKEIANNIIRPKIYLSPEEMETSRLRMARFGIDFEMPIIMFGILGSDNSKSLPLEYMSQIIDNTIKKTDAQILFNYIPSQKDEALRIFHGISKENQLKVKFDLYAENLRDFLGLLSQCTVLVGNEGGAVNMAKALEIPTFTIFSPWIHKQAWNMFEDGKFHVSVHLADWEPQIYSDHSMKEIKKEVDKYYHLLSPDRFKKSLETFLMQHISPVID